jgi:ElaB/YqjD/DUF883 family membrane-anchored ribosome-binding protein
MADTAENTTADDLQKNLEKQIANLRKDIAKIKRSVEDQSSKFADIAGEQASGLSDQASTMASRATRGVRTQAHIVSEMARKNPGTATSFLGVVAVVGFLLGVAVGRGMTDTQHRWYR